MGKCPDCGAWDGLEKITEHKSAKADAPSPLAATWTAGVAGESSKESAREALGSVVSAAAVAVPVPLIEAAQTERLVTGIGELDRVLGGGLVHGSIVLLGGDPGIGKSTLLLQAAGRLAGQGVRTLYVTSEESAYQTRLRAERVLEGEAELTGEKVGAAKPRAAEGLDELFVLADTNLARIVEQARRVRPAAVVIDSIQMIYKGDLDASPGSITQLRACCMELAYLAKISGMAIVLVGHVTKDGQLAGPKLLEHLVDAVLSFEGDRHHAHRVVRAIKNRYGTTLEVGLFEMTDRGLSEVKDAGALLDRSEKPRPGSVVCPVMQGTRCLLVEVQALTATGFLGSAKRKATGLDPNRLAMLIAVLEKHGGLRLADQDVFASSVGGLKVIDPAADLALCLAIAGAHYRKALPVGWAAVGEVGLGGEVRAVRQLPQRIRECTRLGYGTIIASGSGVGTSNRQDAAGTVPIGTVGQAIEHLQRV